MLNIPHVQKWLPFGKMHECLVNEEFKIRALIPIFINFRVIYDLHYQQEAQGPHCSPEKKLKSINTYNYIITLIKRRKKTLLTLREFNGSSFEQT